MTQMQVQNIATRRKAAGLTIYKLAKLAGVKWETLRNIERGSRATQSTLVKLESALAEVTEHAPRSR